MGFFSGLTSKFEELSNLVKKHANTDFRDAFAAACAVVSAADGTIDDSEKTKVAGFIKRRDELKCFNPADVIGVFNDIADELSFDMETGKISASKYLRKMRVNQEGAELVVKIACSIGASDGDFDDTEKEAVRWICKEVGVQAQTVGL